MKNTPVKYSVRLLNSDGSFNGYLNNNGKSAWSLPFAIKNAKEFVNMHIEGNFDFVLEDEFGKQLPNPMKGKLPVRDDVKVVEYHRKPTPSEIRFGHGATHYLEVPIEECSEVYKGKRFVKRIFTNPVDGLRYFR